MDSKRFGFYSNILPGVLILLIVVAYTLLGFLITPIGDDLGFIESYRAENDCWYAFPRHIYRAWLFNNARMADILNPIEYIFMPEWLRALCNGIVVGLMYYLATVLSFGFNSRSPYLSVVVIFIITFVMRWDGIWMEFNTFFNYIWSSSFVMLELVFLFSKRSQSGKWYWWLFLPFCFLASAMHEAIGAPLAFALFLFCIITPFYKEASLLRRSAIIVMIAGGLFTVTSPASYGRIGTMLQPESKVQIVFGSAIFVVILLLLTLYLLIFRKRMLRVLIRSKWIVFVVISLCSSGFMILSGYGGRTGWFAQLFALIAVFQVVDRLNIDINRTVGAVCSGLFSAMIVFHLWMLVEWQHRLFKETNEVIAEYKKATDGIVFFDYTKDSQLPWYLLRKNHGVPDDDDTYYRYRMRRHYGEGKQLVILPTSFNPIPDTLPTPIRYEDFLLTSRLPEHVVGDTIVAQYPRRITHIEGNEYVINEFDYKGRRLYLMSLMDRDRGEK